MIILFGMVIGIGVVSGVGLAVLEIEAQMVLRDDYARAIENDEIFDPSYL